MKNIPLTIAGQQIEPGTQVNIKIPAPDLYTQTEIGIPIHIFHGKSAGPKIFVVGTIHGDELNSIEIIRRLHTGAFGRMNMPQLRVNFDIPGAKKLAKAFEVPVIIDAKIRDGSLRGAASELGIPVLVYEGGEALRFNEMYIRIGVRGILRVLHYLNMLPMAKKPTPMTQKSHIAQSSSWVRATTSGLVQPMKQITQSVKKGELLAYVHDPFLTNPTQSIIAPFEGIIIGMTNLPLVNEGDAMFHLASLKRLRNVIAYIDELRDHLLDPH